MGENRGQKIMSVDSDAAAALRKTLSSPSQEVQLELSVSRPIAEQILRLLEADEVSGAIVVPVKELFTTTESAAMLGLSRATLMKLIDSGEIEATKVGTHHRIPAQSLVAFRRSREVSRERAAEALNEFATRDTNFQSNVRFRGEVASAHGQIQPGE